MHGGLGTQDIWNAKYFVVLLLRDAVFREMADYVCIRGAL